MAESDLIRGNVDTVILKVLYEGDRYGYDMIKQINAKSGGQWEIKQPTLYACLKRLEKQGFVSSYWDASENSGGRRKYYTLTDSGREVFVSYKSEWERSRDLFGELISDDEPILPVDDFSDVEDDDYAVPKRRSSRPARPKQAKTVPSDGISDKPDSEIEYIPPVFSETEYVHSVPEDDAEDDMLADSDEVSDTSVSSDSDSPHESDLPAAEREYVQQSMFDAPADKTSETTEAAESAQADDDTDDDIDERAAEQEQTQREQFSPVYDEPVVTATDPHTLIQEIYAQTYTGNRSYFDARGTAEQEKAPSAASVPQKTEVAAPPAPAPAQERSALLPYNNDNLPEAREEESLARREYKDILGDLVTRCEERNVQSEAEREQAASAAPAANGRIQIKRFDEVTRSVAELGNEVTVRAHNDSAKQYTHKYYYYSNRLMMTHYTAMCAIMFLLGLTLFLTFYIGLGMRMRYDYVLYIIAGLFPIVMFIAAVIVFAGNPDKKKRININFRFSMIIRFVILIQVAVVTYCFNLIWGMPVGFSAYYIPSIVIPLVYALFIPVSEAIFMTLLKSQRYAVE